ncbi:MAG: hypothetical protein QXJ62_01330 [Nitrososphaeria archaeon]
MGAGEKKKGLKYNVEKRKTWVYGFWYIQRIALTLRKAWRIKRLLRNNVHHRQEQPAHYSGKEKIFIKAGD